MKLTRGGRIALEILGPAPVGIFVLLVNTAGHALWRALHGDSRWMTPGVSFKDLGILILFAYVFAGGQSLAYAAIMEWRFVRGLDPRTWRSVVLSTGLGFLSGAVIVVGYGFNRPDWFTGLLYFGGTGTAVGFILGALIKWLSPDPG